MSSHIRRFTILAATLSLLCIHLISVAAITPGSMPTPYVNEGDMASINEAFSIDSCAPWGFGHGGIDFFPNGNLKPFRAVADGTIEDITKLHNVPVDKWQVNLNLRIDATYWVGYAFEPMSDEADADLQLTHIVVSEGQPVSQGDILGYLLTAGPGAHVHFSIYEVWDAICPEPYFTDTARNSILTVLGWTWPYARICYGLEQPIPAAPILLDGDPVDWAGIDPVAGDWMNDDLPLGYSGDDLEALYVARSIDSLYLRLDLWDTVNPSFENGPAPHEGRYSVELDTDSPTYPKLYLSVAYDVDNGWWALGHNGSNAPGSPPDLEERADLVEASGSIIEIAVPLASIGNPTRIDRLRAEVVNCCIVPTFDVLDETHCVNNLVFNTPIESLQALSQYVDSLGLHKGTARSLQSKLDSARRALERHQQRRAANLLGAFINHVEAQSGKKIPMGTAHQMILAAEGIVVAIGEG
jgi:hypothetical protein